MTWLHAIFLGALQGVTEFLPVSSSGHLVLAQYFLSFSDEQQNAKEVFFDGMLHLGTLLAVLAYFGKEITGHAKLVLHGSDSSDEKTWPATLPQLSHLGFLVVLATVPAAAMAIFKSDAIKASFNNPEMVASNFLILGAVLITTDYLGRRYQGGTVGAQTQWWQVLLIGAAQACSAIFRGLSRSGMTIGVSLLVGLERTWAVRFSFMMSLIASLGLGGMGILKALKDKDRGDWLTQEFLMLTLLATLVSAVVGYLTITPLIRLVQRCRLWMFGVYVWIVGLSVLCFKGPIKEALDSLEFLR